MSHPDEDYTPDQLVIFVAYSADAREQADAITRIQPDLQRALDEYRRVAGDRVGLKSVRIFTWEQDLSAEVGGQSVVQRHLDRADVFVAVYRDRVGPVSWMELDRARQAGKPVIAVFPAQPRTPDFLEVPEHRKGWADLQEKRRELVEDWTEAESRSVKPVDDYTDDEHLKQIVTREVRLLLPRILKARENPRLHRYWGLAAGALVFASLLLATILWWGDRLTGLGLVGNFWYVLLVALGLATSAFFFGVMRSLGLLEARALGAVWQVGVPVVTGLLVVAAGFPLLEPQQAFPLTVYVHGPGGRQDLVLTGEGEVVLDLGRDRLSRPIGDQGQAYFPSIPAEFRGREVEVSVNARGYRNTGDGARRLDQEALYLAVEREPEVIRGRVVADLTGQPLAGVVLRFGDWDTQTDANGRFRLEIPGSEVQDEMRIELSKPGYRTRSVSVFPGSSELSVGMAREGQ